MNATTQQAIGLFGGTFDPIHYGHLSAARDIFTALKLDKIHFIPCAIPPHRRAFASSQHRLNMVKIALQDHPEFIADDREIKRQGPSYTLETVQSFRHDYGPTTPLCLIIGQDAFASFSSWHRFQEITNYVHLVIVPRPNTTLVLDSSAKQLLNTQVGAPALLMDTPHGKCLFQKVTPLDIQATQIRALIYQQQALNNLLPDAVLKYIKDHKLYTTV